MSGRVAQRARIARVRRLQHVAAAGAVVDAEARVSQLENSAGRLGQLRMVLLDGGDAATGMALGAAHELASRLEAARHGLADAIAGARSAVVERDRERIDARRDQEGADRLHQRAEAEAVARTERRLAAMPRRREKLGERE